MSPLEQQRIILNAAASITSCTHLDESFQRFAAQANRLLGFDRLSLTIVQSDSRSYVVMCHAGVEITETRDGVPTPLDWHPTELTLEVGRRKWLDINEVDQRLGAMHQLDRQRR